jgi:hypothetical protein
VRLAKGDSEGEGAHVSATSASRSLLYYTLLALLHTTCFTSTPPSDAPFALRQPRAVGKTKRALFCTTHYTCFTSASCCTFFFPSSRGRLRRRRSIFFFVHERLFSLALYALLHTTCFTSMSCSPERLFSLALPVGFLLQRFQQLPHTLVT